MRGKFISSSLFALVLLPLTFLAGCGDSGTSPSRGGFYFKLTVVDQGGEPVSDLNISRMCRIEYEVVPGAGDQDAPPMPAGADAGLVESLHPGIKTECTVGSSPGAYPFDEFTLNPAYPNPGTSGTQIGMDTELTAPCDLEISVFDWKNEEVQHFGMPLSESIIGVFLGYAFTGAGNRPLPNGIFRTVFRITEPGTPNVLFADSVYFSGYTDKDPFRQSIGHTNDNGWFSTHDKGYFPSLQGHQPQMGYDGSGTEQGLFSFSSTIDVTVMTELPPGTPGYIYWMTRAIDVSGGANEFEWVFVPDDSVLVQ